MFDGWRAYANTKLANVLFSNLLASKLADTGVVSNSFCPGLIDTNLLTGNSIFGEEGIERLRPAMRSPEEGAVTPVFLAMAAEAGDISGQFFLKTHGNGKAPLDFERPDVAIVAFPWRRLSEWDGAWRAPRCRRIISCIGERAAIISRIFQGNDEISHRINSEIYGRATVIHGLLESKKRSFYEQSPGIYG